MPVLSISPMLSFVLNILYWGTTTSWEIELCAHAGWWGRGRGVSGTLRSILVTFSNRELIHRIIHAKNAYCYLSTNDLDTRFLDPKTVPRVPPNRKIFINDAFSNFEYKHFLIFKDIAKEKDLGYKYIWHRAGKFLVRRGDKDRQVNVIETVADLSAISAAHQRRKVLPTAATETDTLWLDSKTVNVENRGDGMKVAFISATWRGI